MEKRLKVYTLKDLDELREKKQKYLDDVDERQAEIVEKFGTVGE